LGRRSHRNFNPWMRAWRHRIAPWLVVGDGFWLIYILGIGANHVLDGLSSLMPV
jgi:hypothetical protein